MMKSEQAVAVMSRPVRRFVIDTGRPYEEFRKEWEHAVPAWSWSTAIAEAKGGGGWHALQDLSARSAVNGLVNIATFDPSTVMRLAGDRLRAVTYLTGNLVLGEALYRHDPAAIEYIPLRVTIAEVPVETSTITFDKPCDLFAAYTAPEIAVAARDVERAMSEVLRVVGLPIPADLDSG